MTLGEGAWEKVSQKKRMALDGRSWNFKFYKIVHQPERLKSSNLLSIDRNPKVMQILAKKNENTVENTVIVTKILLRVRQNGAVRVANGGNSRTWKASNADNKFICLEFRPHLTLIALMFGQNFPRQENQN